ncbi:hypothetical protein LPJ60_006471 [Coemansia sp. RSA 2675]|nr:hypothetical protein LPJ60_006471 [Coemansia sp. RSA 2675]
MWTVEITRIDNKVDIYRKMLWPEIPGNVLELGPGFAVSLKLLAHTTTSDGSFHVESSIFKLYTVLGPNSFMYSQLQDNAEDNGFNVNYAHLDHPDEKMQISVA